MPRLSFRRWAVAGTVLTAVLAASKVNAEPLSREQLAQSFFDEARTLLARGDVSRACALFSESQRQDPAAGTFLNLALCHEMEGRLATAQFELLDALAQARKDNRSDREAIAVAHLEQLAPRVPKLRLFTHEPQPKELTLELDGAVLASAALNVPIPLNPGAHIVVAHAEGRVPFRWEGVVLEGEVRELEIPELPGIPVPPSPPSPPPPTRSLSAVSIVALATSAALLATAGVSGAVALHEKDIADKECVSSRQYCSADGSAAVSASRRWAWVSTGALLGAVASAATAYVLPRQLRAMPATDGKSIAVLLTRTF